MLWSLIFALGWAASLAAFSLTQNYTLALVLLFCAGFCELSFSSMNQTITQMKAPNEIRGRVLGLFNMSSAGLRIFSGMFVGLIGSQVGIHLSRFGAGVGFFIAICALMFSLRAR